ncbi:unnamed protein product [Mucor hiemalis]
MASDDLKKAYRLCLKLQIQYAFTPDEAYFEIYAHVICLFNKHNSILKNERVESPTEQDFVGEVWTPIMSSIFNNRDLYLKWGDSVPQISTTAKKKLHEEEKIGDRVDMRVVTNIEGTEHDISTGESSGPGKFSDDHHKVLRESKVILDSIVDREHISRSDARRLLIPRFQAIGLDGGLKIMRLVAPGLYTVQYVGSILIPNHVGDLQQLRKKCLPRLNYMKTRISL